MKKKRSTMFLYIIKHAEFAQDGLGKCRGREDTS